MHRPAQMNTCIENCTRCHATCLETINYCLGEGGAHVEPAHQGLLAACADICAASAATMLRGAHQAMHPVCRACAEVCAACASSCEGFGDDESMRRCAAACRASQASCEAMSAH
jgi:hypothetical protein